MSLIVVHSFGDLSVGDEITDQTEADWVLENSPGSVVQIADPAPQENTAAPAADQETEEQGSAQ